MRIFSLKNRTILYVFVLGSLGIYLSSCKIGEPLENKTRLTKEEKMVIKLKNRERKKSMAEYEAAVRAHRKNQTEATQKMMKEAKKQQRKNNRIHQRSLWERLFGNSCSK